MQDGLAKWLCTGQYQPCMHACMHACLLQPLAMGESCQGPQGANMMAEQPGMYQEHSRMGLALAVWLCSKQHRFVECCQHECMDLSVSLQLWSASRLSPSSLIAIHGT